MTDKSPTRLLTDEPDGGSASDDRRAVDVDVTSDGPAWAPETLEGLHSLLYGIDLGSPNLEAGLQRLTVRHGDAVYSELIYLLCHLRFDNFQARSHWEQLLAHRASMQERLGTKLDLRVALVSYFVEVCHKLENPKIIEMQLFERTRASAYRDELTGLYNYRMLREHLEREVKGSERIGTPLSVVMVDVDNFKRHNDRHGHEAGNLALIEMAGLLTKSLRQADIAARYGGEEFVLILPATPKTDAYRVAERTRLAVEAHHFVHKEGDPGARLTISMGLATFPADGVNASELIRSADRALYSAKSNGKNHVTLFGRSQRSFERVETSIEGTYRMLADESNALSTVNVSEAGLMFMTEQDIPVGTVIQVELSLPDPYGQVKASGHVVHVEADKPGSQRTAVKITSTNRDDRDRLMRYLRERDLCGESKKVG